MTERTPEQDWSGLLLDRDFSSHVASKAVELAESGDRGAALFLLRGFSSWVRAGFRLPSEVKLYFARAFDRIVEGDNPEKVLHIKRGVGRPKKGEFEQEDLFIFAAIMKAMANGQSYQDAIATVGEDRGIGERTAGRAYSRINTLLNASD